MQKITAADLAEVATRSEHTPEPTFPAALASVAHYTEAQQREMAAGALKTLRAYVAKAVRWQAACARYSRGEAEAPKVSGMPSRGTAKQSYSKSAYLAVWLGWDREATRCYALIDQVRLVQAAEAILGK
jgi:hypothetical protein